MMRAHKPYAGKVPLLYFCSKPNQQQQNGHPTRRHLWRGMNNKGRSRNGKCAGGETSTEKALHNNANVMEGHTLHCSHWINFKLFLFVLLCEMLLSHIFWAEENLLIIWKKSYGF
jgi:hypothetical protein